jgi:iron uptake system component EfeO
VVRRVLALLAVPAVVVACSSGFGSSGGSPSGSTGAGSKKVNSIEVTLSDAGCEPRSISTTAGPTTFEVTNDNTAAVTEFEVMQGDHILGEVENVIPGADRSFSLNLAEGGYRTNCPGGSKFDTGTLEVGAATDGAAADSSARDAAVQSYLTYVNSEADQLIRATAPFVAAVKAGDVETAKQKYAAARAHYESIEPIAESFGDLDPAIDGREGDVPDSEWGGFHRIEKALWVDNDAAAVGPVADKLTADIQQLRTQIDTVKLEPAQIANGAVELLNEISTSKITGEEDRYSHTDLSDFAANLAGSKAAFESLKPLLATDKADLSNQIEDRFTAVQAALDAHKGNDPTGYGYVLFVTLAPDQTRAVSTTLDTLAEPLSRVAAEVL